MSYSQTLMVLAKLQLDRDFRNSFLSEPATALQRFDLTIDECGALCRLEPHAVDRLGRMAEWHRVQRISEHLPWLDLSLRPSLDGYFAGFQAAVLPQLVNRMEAVAFCAYIEALPAGTPPYLAELARYERVRIELAWNLDGRNETVRIEKFAYPIESIRASLHAPGWPAAAPQETLLSFRKVPFLPAVIVRAENRAS